MSLIHSAQVEAFARVLRGPEWTTDLLQRIWQAFVVALEPGLFLFKIYNGYW